MQFTSKQLGQVEIDQSTIITFPAGIPALEHCTTFKLFHNATHAEPHVFWMQSLDDPGVIFSITIPETLGINYEIELNDAEVAQLGLSSQKEALILVILTNQEEHSHPALGKLKANIHNPFVINLHNRTGLQKLGLQSDLLLHNRS
ncbi:flagellar assembly protein FliW [Neisseriaceae bacterium TC5R-5]|nr:flagellar assembly protein FliW [Neisseriaceae bacterium TC5R-5]